MKKIKLLFMAAVIVSSTTANAYIKVEPDTTEAPKDWFHKDAIKDNYRGLSTERVYEMLKDRDSETVIVAVLDSGVDIEHEDLKGNVWVNEDEIPGNGKDDDNNGYVDDVNGWNFIGGENGENVHHDSYEITREYVKYKKMFDGVDANKLSKKQKKQYEYYQEIKSTFEKKHEELKTQQKGFLAFYEKFEKAQKTLQGLLGKKEITEADLKKIESEDEEVIKAKKLFEYILSIGYSAERLESAKNYYESALNYGYNADYDPRNIVGDHYEDVRERYYGNNDVNGPDSEHGTHVAGIIAAVRNNGIGMDGIANNVKIMSVRTVPDGDERDKDIANAIRYAVDNGARIINMSFGKGYSPYKKEVDKAVKYAESKNVLLIHAAGNSSLNIDQEDNFPTKKLLKSKKTPKNWLEIGASSWGDNKHFVADFSNYGKKTVDVFAPGVDIYSTTPNQTYESLSGTSMAAPATSGVAAILMSYYPDLTAVEVKNIIIESSVKYDLKINKPGMNPEEENGMIAFGDLSITGGIVNAFKAVQMAEQMSRR